MRISTHTFFETSTSRLSELQANLMRTQQQISSGRRLLTPADDPVAAARAYDVSQARSVNEQFGANRENVKSALGMEEGVLQSVTSLLQDVKTLLVGAGNGAYSDTDRQSIATELKGRFEELLGLANSDDGMGGYMFAGFQSGTQPFAQTATGALYNGDQGARMLQVGTSRQIAFSDSGSAVFQQIKNGNGSFALSAAAGNAGSGTFSPGAVTDTSLLTGHNYSVTFAVSAAGTTYDVVDVTSGTTLSAGNAYSSGAAITFDGIQFEVGGQPANGDSFAVAPSTNQSVFSTMKDLIDLLNTPVAGAAGKGNLTNGLAVAHGNLDNALDNILTVRAAVGSRLKEIDALDNAGADADIQYAQTLSALQDLDYSKAISSLMQQQTTLNAAQQTFAKVSGLSLFNYL
ncbi:flagellar hook-associated protein FlgL [Noviherbaspirillum sedimenti]|uniref:Flagellar hook-associated protein 3 n=1 Tax=Noviherbaspirillum sedimenti TaxID=2320865 RepID=A0A3A3FYA8_9BURK|nr:flagellar hook-associated protein FlgL [Noviherbaspirillum sedimenti]RJG01173.1 flagellar hook-associated protein 3 [Noviherbaspirillum sedimenti]